MQVYYDRDADLALVTGRKVAVVGYGNQAHAHALNLRDSGVTEIAVALGENSASTAKAKDAGFTVLSNAEAACWADLVMVLAPDELQAAIYADHYHANMKPGAAIAFAHGLNIHFKLIEPRADLDVILIAPKGPGRALRAEYVAGGGLLGVIAVAQDASGGARDLALAYAAAIGCGRSGIMETTFREECETDLFGEQAVLCGGIPDLITAGFETLVEAGYAPEMAYFECLHETKQIVDLLYERGIVEMRRAISNTAEYGGAVTGPRIIDAETKIEMKRVLDDIQSGRFVARFVEDSRAGWPDLDASRKAAAAHPIEQVGASMRAMMPWLANDGNLNRGDIGIASSDDAPS